MRKKIFLGHQTTKGRIVYHRKKHMFNQKDADRVVFATYSDWFPAEDPDYEKWFWPMKSSLDLINQRYNEFLYRYSKEKGIDRQLRERLLQGLGPTEAENMMNSIYNALIRIMNETKAISGFISWIPYVGPTVASISAFWEFLQDILDLHERPVLSKPAKAKTKPDVYIK